MHRFNLVRTFLMVSVFFSVSVNHHRVAAASIMGTKTQCEALFIETRYQQPQPLMMQEQYTGEDKGLYRDPITGEKWNVKYYTKRERQEFEIFDNGGIFVDRKNQKIESEFDNESLNFQESIFVVDLHFRMYFIKRDERGRIHHSSLVAGGGVLFAGMAAFMGGQLRVLDDSSGHYKSDPERTKWFLRELHRRGFDLSRLLLTGRVARHYGNGRAALDAKEVERMVLIP